MTKKELRQKVWLKFNKRCAYCGKKLEYKDMQVDHLKPLAYAPFPDDKNSEVNSFINLMPSCRRCNYYKRANNLEQFRRLIRTLHERISNRYISKVAIDYSIIEIRPFNGIFYFEKF
ncbi:MAG: HNH endonuclease [Candidatus Marinimicrobia bacterium]|nr:HNH endonuclease [Candidatus Neomarinimicrobiota bacterium]MCK4447671.1 HNH endonuclease [Candidatus Neomarinimicrobiota bacterium]